jgi:hypothetical protein
MQDYETLEVLPRRAMFEGAPVKIGKSALLRVVCAAIREDRDDTENERGVRSGKRLPSGCSRRACPVGGQQGQPNRIADFDSPRGGIVRVHPQNLTGLSEFLRAHRSRSEFFHRIF